MCIRDSRNTEEVEAESISYAVCQYFGIQTGENSFGYIASWSKDKELKELRASLETINKTSCELINDIERNYKMCIRDRWWTSPKVRWATWAATLIGAGTASPPGWNGAPALSPGAMGKWGCRNPDSPGVSPREPPGSSPMANGEPEAMKISPPGTPFSLTGTWTAAPVSYTHLVL